MSRLPPGGRLRVEIAVDDSDWETVLPGAADVVIAAAEAAWGLAGMPGVDAELSVLLTGDAAVQDLNRAHRGKDSPTNVLAFPLGETPVPGGAPWLLGDVVLALGTVRHEAVRDGKALDAHVAHLVVHGLLHLVGYDHEAAAQAEAMEAVEVEALRRLGRPNPYAAVSDAAE